MARKEKTELTAAEMFRLTNGITPQDNAINDMLDPERVKLINQQRGEEFAQNNRKYKHKKTKEKRPDHKKHKSEEW